MFNLTSAQAATILGRIHFANGMDEMGWTTWTYALELADRLELFAKVAEYKTEKDPVSRTLTAWGIFSHQAYKLTRPLFFPTCCCLMELQVLLLLAHEAPTVPNSA